MYILALGFILLQQVQLASVDGIVTKPLGAEPLGSATVTLIPTTSGSGPMRRAVVTEDDGRFAIRDVVPGLYQLVAESPRYGQIAYGQRRPDGPGAVLSIAAGQRIADLRLSMIPTGVIAGRITGRNGEPAVSATVQALKYVYRNGKRVLQPAQMVATDERGEYRLFWLPAGQYVVAAALNEVQGFIALAKPALPGVNTPTRAVFQQAPPFFADSFLTANVVNRVLDDGTVQEESWATVFYPSTTDARFAVPIDLGPGATMSGVNFSIGPTHVQRVRGRVIGATAGSFPAVTLLPENSVVEIRAMGQAAAGDGSFEFRGIRPGSYYLSVITRTGLVGTPVAVEVSDRDIEDLRIPLIPGIQIGANLLLDNPSEGSGPRPASGIGVFLISDNFGTTVGSNGQSQRESGKATFTDVPPGNYQIGIDPAQDLQLEGKVFHVKSVRLGIEEANDGIQVTTDMNPTHLDIVLTSESGSLEGTVMGAGQVAVTGATVVLVPATGRKRSNLYQSAITDSTGRFQLSNIAPGDYKLFAWDDVETGAWQNADFMRPYEARGQLVHVAGNSNQELRLILIHNP
jgi:Carboxypeptidase regulatory-like domain